MASKLCRNRALASAMRPSQPAIRARNEVVNGAVMRSLATTARQNVALPKEVPNPRSAPREPMGVLTAPIVNPVDKYQSKADNMHKYGSWLMGCLPKYIQQFSVWKDELTIYICPSGVIPVFSFLKYNSSAEFTQVSDITAVDFPTRDQRFEIVYNLLSVRHNARIRVKTYADETSPVPSLIALYDGANWYEREVYDLFGIRYDEEKKRIVTEPLELTQAFRNFEGGSSAWEQLGDGLDRKPESFKLPTPKPEPPKEEPKK
ncbi:hypothetical protein B0T17DRAFT_589004 [Bombardia bombarda]|uniref:NADH:ubiquinone oxidoreductase 30kDa subunit domain-containing protein n=1 Tax=Bombardia bombarda TaxID=252184 RepID=A0AA40C9D0_9PEZI|nr:hypothetical protein B0T17DRAFT_589004 [Bombardia bombarda]